MIDRFSELIRAAKPGRVRRDTPLSERGRRELAEYEALETGQRARHARRRVPGRRGNRWRRPVPVLAGSSLVLIMVAVAVVLVSVLRAGPVVASTPPLLEATQISASSTEVLTQMAATRTQRPDDTGTGTGVIRAQTWALNTTIGDDGSISTSRVEPQWNETAFAPDGTVTVRLTAADPFPGQDATGLAEPGTLLAEETFPPGTYDTGLPGPPPTDPAHVEDYLLELTGEEQLTTGQTFVEVAGLLSSIRLTAAQETALITYLATRDGITVTGEVTDRLGRSGVALTAADRLPGEVEDVLIVSPQTGKIIAAETRYIGTDRTDIPSPAVIDYTAWER